MLGKIRASIPDSRNINWIIVLCDSRDILKAECKSLGLPYITIDTPETKDSIHLKINEGVKHCKPGWFQGLDDDTVFNPGSLDAVTRFGEQYDIIIGKQLLRDGSIRPAQMPVRCLTDGAQMLVRTEIIAQHPMVSLPSDPQNDCELMLRCWNSTEKRLILHEPVSYYNWLR